MPLNLDTLIFESHRRGGRGDDSSTSSSKSDVKVAPDDGRTDGETNEEHKPEHIKGVDHIAVLLIIIDDLPHEAMWRLWEEQYLHGKEFSSEQEGSLITPEVDPHPDNPPTEKSSSKESYPDIITDAATLIDTVQPVPPSLRAAITPVRFFIHAKHPEKLQSKWVRDRLVSFHLLPGWGSLVLTEVMVRMLKEVREHMVPD